MIQFRYYCLVRSIVFLSLASLSQGQPALRTLSLDDTIDEAIAHNLELAAERYNLSIAEARQITAGLRPNPVFTVTSQTLDLLGAGFNANSPVGPNQVNAHTDFVLERGGKRERRIALAQSERSLAEMQLRDFVRGLVWEVRSTFTDVLQARDAVALAEDNLRTLRGIVDVNETRVRGGDLAGVELERSRVAVIQYETAVEQARLRLDQANVQLVRLLGLSPGVAVEFTGTHRDRPPIATYGELVTRALENRPDLRVTQQAQARSQADLRLQLANGKVDYVVGSEYSYQRAFGVGGSTLGFSFSMPLPVNNRNQGEIQRAQRESEQAAARIAAIETRIRAELDAAYRQYQSSRRLLDNISSALLARARSVRDTTEYSYRRGEATLIEFLDAQRTFNDSIQAYNEARAGLARSLYLIDAVSALDDTQR